MRYLKPFRRYLHIQLTHAGDVAAGPAQIRDEAYLNRIAGGGEDNGDRAGRSLGREIGRGVGDNHRNLTAHEIGGNRGQTVIMSLRPAIFDGHILALDVAAFLQAIAKRGDIEHIPIRRGYVEESDHRHRWPLGPRRKRPRRSGDREKGNELASPHDYPLKGYAP
jgi:hypothetical protein